MLLCSHGRMERHDRRDFSSVGSGRLLGDQQEGDKYTGETCLCHRCYAPSKRYLETEDFEVKTMRKVRQRVECAAAGGFMKGSNRSRIVKWDPDGRNVRPGSGNTSFISFISIMLIMTIMTIICIYLYYSS